MLNKARVTADGWSPKGEAVVHRGDRQLLIWQGIVGEEADVALIHEGRQQSYAHWDHAVTRHPHRRHPPCEHYSPCGGCPWLHLMPEGQRDGRLQLLDQALEAAGLSEVRLGRWFPSPDGFTDYRYLVKVGVGYNAYGKVKIGAWGRRSRTIVPIPDCQVAAPVLRRVMAVLAHHVLDLEIQPYDASTDRGSLRSAVLRASRTTNEVLVTLVSGRHTREIQELAERIGQNCSEVVGVWLHLNDDPGNAILQRDGDGEIGLRHLLGKDTVEERLGEVSYLVGPGDFFQTNPAMAAALYQRVVERLGAGPQDAVLDLYCGVGGMALQLAGQAAFVLGVEEVEGAVRRARDAARINRREAEFIAGRVEDVLPTLQERLGGTAPLVVVNPARRGLEEGVLPALLELGPRRIAYVSCNPEALARDLALFAAEGFRAGPIDAFDMFPNTPHVECLTVLEAPEGAAPTRRPPRRRLVAPPAGQGRRAGG